MMEEYRTAVGMLLDEILGNEKRKIEELAEKMYSSIKRGGLIYAFGTGHSHMLVEEMFYRAGGLAPVYPVLIGALMLHEGAVRSSKLERLRGFGETLADSLPIGKKDVVVVFSNSGVNSVPVEFAVRAKEKGAFVAAVTSFKHANSVEPRNRYGKRLYEVVDLAIDNHVPYGDAALKKDGYGFAPLSSVAGAFIVNSIVAEVVEIFARKGEKPPIFVSANTEDGDKINKELVDKFSKLIPAL